jgi:mono/diheme cytochrome c family protein
MKAVLRALLLLLVVAAIAAGLAAYSIASRGLSTREAPSAVETLIARAMRRLATPAAARAQANPVAATPEVLDEALAHFADHCASCHANDGSGATEMGRSFYPPAPDMRADATQALTDGELFSIIEHGVRLTGMPAWGTGTPEGEQQSWALVHFIRRLSSLTPDDIARMEELNPRSPQLVREEDEIRRFLAGEQAEPPAAGGAPPAPHKEPH